MPIGFSAKRARAKAALEDKTRLTDSQVASTREQFESVGALVEELKFVAGKLEDAAAGFLSTTRKRS